ncbi:MAG TPA: chromate efflux transporter [Syntrophorhabdaceae bacterium]|nr:chromate efflux transporter [Syntrophorhabdaceae bacterium]
MTPGPHTVSIAGLFLAFLRLGLTAFGGPTMVAYIGELSVKKKKWLDPETFKNGVALCQSIPGATAIQVAAYVGLKVRGISGAAATYIGFSLPAFLFMLVLSWSYMRLGNLPWVISLFSGLQVIVVAMVANAAYTFGRGAMKYYLDAVIALLSAAAFWYGISPFIVILCAALFGMIAFRTIRSGSPHDIDAAHKRFIKQFFVPILIIAVFMILIFTANRGWFTLALLMMKVDLFAFGGGFASIPLMLQEVVNVRGWMDSKTFMDGIALGQVTPGPIVITATFVGFLTNGLAGAIIATIAMLSPSFVLLILGEHIFSRLRRSTLFNRATKGILASFVGLLLFVTIRFAVAVPWDTMRLVVIVAAIAALLKKIDILYIVLAGALISIFLL